MIREIIIFLFGFVAMYLLLSFLSKLKISKTESGQTSTDGLKDLLLTAEVSELIATPEFKNVMQTKEFSNYVKQLSKENIKLIATKLIGE